MGGSGAELSRGSWPPSGAAASTLNGFGIRTENWKEVSFKLRGIVLISTRWYFFLNYFTQCFNVFGTISEKNLIFSTDVKE